jgi:hypothetical protein
MWQTFIAAEQIKGDKTELIRGVTLLRNALTYTKNDKQDFLNELIKELYNLIPQDNKNANEIVKKLEWFSMHPESLINNRQMFLDDLAKVKEFKLQIKDKNIKETQEHYRDELVNIIKDIADENGGELQDMLSIYYKIAPIQLDKTGAALALKRAVKSFDRAVYLENAEFFDKIRDLRLGSAPTDILTILLSFITLSLGLGYSKDNDERKSIMLKSGIPIVGAICTATFSATKLVSGGKSLALGFLSGIVLNRLGVIADNIRKQKNSRNNDVQKSAS